MAFTEQFLDDLRARLPVSVVVGKKVQLKKKGSEFVGLSPFNKENTASFTVNDSKGLWHDFSANKGGDIFAFLVEAEGLSFPEAVEQCADLAGVPLPKPNGSDRHAVGTGGIPGDRDDGQGDPGPMPPDSAPPGNGPGDASAITATYDYTDPQGSVIYQVCRIEWQEDGRHKKTFIQRRPTPENDGHWIWGLGAGEYLRGRGGDWHQATKDRLAKWKSADKRTIAEASEHGLYRLVELRESDPEERVFLPEGEKDVDTLAAWGLTASTNSGGARHWKPEFAEFFRNRDVVIPIDNDDPGRERAGLVGTSLHGVARSVRVLDFATIWAGAPKGADVTDWRDQLGGTAEHLQTIVAKLPAWAPPLRESRYGLVMWADQDQPGEEYEYLIEDLIPEKEPVLIIGESQSGKSFFTMHMAVEGAQGNTFFGRRILKPFGIIYLAYEAGKGFKHRMRAYRAHHGLDLEDIPFAVLTKPVSIWSEAINTEQLIEELLWIGASRFRGVPLGAVVIDTHNAATSGASEIDSKEVSLIRDRYKAIMRATNAGLWIIGHKNAAGKHRGSELIYNNIETAIDISRKVRVQDKQAFPIQDNAGRWIRSAKVLKQREGIDGESWDFVLGTVTVGTNKFGRPRTSCVVMPPSTGEEHEQQQAANDAAGRPLNKQTKVLMEAILQALDDNGVPPPPALQLPRSIAKVVDYNHVKSLFARKELNDGDDPKEHAGRLRTALSRARTDLANRRVIGTDNPYIWWTGKPLAGVRATQRPIYEVRRDEAPLPLDAGDFIP